MIIIARFRYYKAVTPACYIIEFTIEEWREYLNLEDNNLRAGYVLHFLHLGEDTTRNEFWWIPFDEGCGLAICPDAKIYRNTNPTPEQSTRRIRVTFGQRL